MIEDHAAKPAALPWYDFASTRAVLDAVWHETRTELRSAGIPGAPVALDHTTPHEELATLPYLTLSQCCGLDLFQSHMHNVIPFAAPVIGVLDAPPGSYFSYIVRGAALDRERLVVAINSRTSHSGNTAIRDWLHTNGHRDFAVVYTGSHYESIRALREGRAHLAAIDALSWRHLDGRGLTIVDASAPVAAPPFIAGVQSSTPKEALIAALNTAFQRRGGSLGITGVVAVSHCEYLEVVNQAARHGVLPTFTANDRQFCE